MKNKNMVMMAVIWCMLLLSGCKEQEVIFVDAKDPVTMETKAETADELTESPDLPVKETTISNEKEPVSIVVHVCGAVASPGVYELDENSRVIDAVETAGGLLNPITGDFINLAAPITDGMMIRIPTAEETVRLQQSGGMAEPGLLQPDGVDTADSKKVNINTADKALLCTLPGIGETRAGAIIDYRENNGIFSKIEDIMNVSGIKESSFQKIKEYITVK